MDFTFNVMVDGEVTTSFWSSAKERIFRIWSFRLDEQMVINALESMKLIKVASIVTEDNNYNDNGTFKITKSLLNYPALL
jgi:hypothetical protein